MPRGYGLAAACLAALAVSGCRNEAPKLPEPAPARGATLTPNLDRLRQAVAAAATLPGVRRATWGVAVHSLDRDERLVEVNPHALLLPASVSKVVAAATAGEAVGWDYSYETTLRAAGPIVNGVLQGDLVAIGAGDPTIEGRAGQGLQGWVAAVKAAGIRRVQGRIVGDDDRLEEPRPAMSWAWDDIGFPTGILFGALNVYENRLVVTVAPGASAGAPAVTTVERYAQSRALVNRVTTGLPSSIEVVYPEQRPGDAHLTLVGSIPLRSKPVPVLVTAGNPTVWFASVLRDRLVQSGIEVQGAAVDGDDARPAATRGGQTIHVHRSAPLSAIVQPMLKNSVNLYAEAAMRLNAPRPGPATMDAALDGLRRRLAAWGIATDAQQLVDGSGVSRRSVISADALCIVLRRMHDATLRSPFMQALPVAGVDGTLLDRFGGTAGARNVRAKTGTMSNVRSLTGYVTTRDGERLAFAIMANNFEGSGDAANAAIDAMVVRLAEFRRDTAPPRNSTK